MTTVTPLGTLRRRLAFSTALAGGLVSVAAPAAAQVGPNQMGTIASVATNGAGATNVNNATPNVVTVTLGNTRTILNWTDLNVASGKTLNFVFGGNTDAVLNRVIGPTSTTIDGTVNGYVGGSFGGQVFILNPNGVVVGGSAVFNLGGVAAGTLDLADLDFLDGDNSYSFSGPSGAAISIASGAKITAANGPIMLLAGTIANAGTLKATNGDVVLTTASDVTAVLNAGSLVSLTITKGSAVSGGIVAGGTIEGKNVYLAAVSKDALVDALLNVSGTVTATGAAPSDKGVVLTAGANATNVVVSTDPGSETTGPANIQIGGSVGSAKDIEVVTTGAVSGSGTLNATGAVSGIAATSFATGKITAGTNISLSSAKIGAATQDLNLDATDNITLTGPAIGRDIALKAGGTITAGSLSAGDDVAVQGGGAVTLGAVATGAVNDSLPPIDTAATGAADVLAGGLLDGFDARIVSGDTLTLNAAPNVQGDALLQAKAFAGGNELAGTVTGLRAVYKTSGGYTIASPTTYTGRLSLRAQDDVTVNAALKTTGDLTLQSDLGGVVLAAPTESTSGGVTLQGATVTLNGAAVKASTFVQVTSPQTLVNGSATINAQNVSFGGKIDAGGGGTNSLAITASNVAAFSGEIGGINPLSTFTVNGDSRLFTGLVKTDGNLTFNGGVKINQNTTLDAGSGVLTVTGPIVADTGVTAGKTLTLDAGGTNSGNDAPADSSQNIVVGDIGTSGALLGNVTFLKDARLKGNITSGGTVQFNGDTVLAGTGDTTITAANAIFGNNNQDDIWALNSTIQGLAVVVTGDATFKGDVGRDETGFGLRAFGLSANTVDAGFLLGNKINAGVLAASVQTGDLTLSSGSNLVIGTVGAISGLNATNGSVIVTTNSGKNLTINGAVTARNDITLTSGGNLSGTANLTAGVGNALGGDVTITAAGSVSTGSINARAVSITGNGITPGAITTTTNITLDGGSGGIGTAGVDLSLTTPGFILLKSAAVGRDIILTSTAGGAITTGALDASRDVSLSSTSTLALTPGGAITTGNVEADRDIAIRSSSVAVGGGTITTGTLAARDDVVLSTSAAIATGGITAGATIGGNGPVDANGAADALAGTTLTGHDLRLTAGAGIVASAPLTANGTGSDIILDGGATGIGNVATNFSAIAGGALTIAGTSPVRGFDVTLQSSGPLSAGNVSAARDLVVSGGEGYVIGALPVSDGSTTIGTFTAGRDATIQANSTLSFGAGSSATRNLTVRAANLDALIGTLPTVGGNADFTDTEGDFTLTGFSAGGSLAVRTTNGNLSVGALTAATDMTLAASGGALTITDSLNLGALGTLSVGGATVTQTGGVITANRLQGTSSGATFLNSLNAIANLGPYTANGLTLRTSGPLAITGAVDGGSFVTLATGGALAINNTLGTTGTLTLTTTGGISQTAAVTASLLTGSASGAANLGRTDNAIANLGNFTASGLTVRTGGGLNVVGTANGNGGAVVLGAGGALSLTGSAVTSGGSGVTLSSGAGMTLASGSSVGTGSGAITLTSGGTLASAATIGTGGTVSATSTGNLAVTGGSIGGNGVTLSATGPAATLSIAAPVSAGTGTLALSAPGGISQSAAGILTANLLTASSTSGAVALAAALNNFASIGPVSGTSVAINDAGGLTVAGAVTGTNGVAITTSGPLTVNAGVSSTNSPITLASGAGAMTLNAGVNAGTGTVTLSGASLSQSASGGITAGRLNGTFTGALLINLAGNNIGQLGDLTAAQIAVTTSGPLTIAAGTIRSTGAAGTDPGIALSANGITQASGSLLDGGAQSVQLNAGGGNVTLGGQITTTSAAANAVAIRNAGSVQLGTISAANGGIALGETGAAIGGPITQGASTTITAATLSAVAPGAAITLGNAGNSIGALGAITAASLLVRDDTAGLALNGNVAVTGTLALQVANGAVTQAAGTTLAAGLLRGTSNGGASFTNAGNQVAALGPWTNVGAGGVRLTTAGALTLAGNVTSGSGDIVLNAAGIAGTTRTVSTAGNVTLAAGGGALDIGTVNATGGTATLSGATVFAGTVTGAGIGATGGAVDIGTATSTGGISLTATSGDLKLATGTAATGATLTKTGGTGSLQVGTLTSASGNVSLSSATAATLGTVEATTGSLDVQAASIDATTLKAGGQLTLAATSGALKLGTGTAGTGASLTKSGGTGALEVTSLTSAGGNVLVTSATAATLGNVEATAGKLDVTAASIDATTLKAGQTLALTASSGDLKLGTGTAGTGATLTKNGGTGALQVTSLTSAAGNIALTSATAATLGTVQATAGNLDVNAASIDATTLKAGQLLTLTAGSGTLKLGTGTAGTGATLTKNGATGTLQVVTGLTSTGGNVAITSATDATLGAIEATAGNLTVNASAITQASGKAGQALSLTASSGGLTLGGGTAGTTATLTKTGSTGDLELTNALTAQGNVAVSTATNAKIGSITSAAGNIAVTATTSATGSVTGTGTGAAAGASLSAPGSASTVTVLASDMAKLNAVDAATVRVEAAQLELSGIMTGRTAINLVNNKAGTTTSLGSVAQAAGFGLNQTEVNFLRSPTITIASVGGNANNIAIGDLKLESATGSTRLNLYTTGRIDVTGRFESNGASTRTLQIGGDATDAGKGTVLRVAATDTGGGRLLFEGATVDLRAAKIGVGQDERFLDAAGLGLTPGATGISQAEVSSKFIANGSSTLYRAARPYAAANGGDVLIKAGALKVSYTDYVLVQNTAPAGATAAGVLLAGSLRPMLTLSSSGDNGANAAAIFAEIDGRKGLQAAILPPDYIKLVGVNRANTRINGCLVGSGAGGCIVSTLAQPLINVFDGSRADVLSAGNELPIVFDPIVGANNEALFAGLSAIEDLATDPECKPSETKTCKAPERK